METVGLEMKDWDRCSLGEEGECSDKCWRLREVLDIESAPVPDPDLHRAS